LKSGKQTPLPTFQQPLLLECYKSIQTDFVAFGVCTRPPTVVAGKDCEFLTYPKVMLFVTHYAMPKPGC
jgi:hypothetical protein